MEGFTFIDIFATKGIEYILVIGFMIVFVGFWIYLKDEQIKTDMILKPLNEISGKTPLVLFKEAV